jgi:hypothetical protein
LHSEVAGGGSSLSYPSLRFTAKWVLVATLSDSILIEHRLVNEVEDPTMGRLITPVPKKPETGGAAAPSVPEPTGAQQKTEGSAERILKYIPAEVVAFYVAALGVIDSLPKETPGMKSAYWVVLILGLIVAPLYILKLGKWAKTATLQAIWSGVAFLVWAYTLGGAFKQIPNFHQPWIGSLLLLAVTLIAALLPLPKESEG